MSITLHSRNKINDSTLCNVHIQVLKILALKVALKFVKQIVYALCNFCYWCFVEMFLFGCIVCITKFLGVPTKLFVNFMAPLNLSTNFKVKALFGNHNVTNGGEIVFNPNLIASNSYAPPQAPIIIFSN
jgi:hypothetical protein